jgi:hypothetical protein
VAFAVYARGKSSVRARSRVSPSTAVGSSAHERWITVVRWIDAARNGQLFALAGLGELARRQVAKQVVLALAGRAGRRLGEDLPSAAFVGAAIAA